jgi:hypothetical protein
MNIDRRLLEIIGRRLPAIYDVIPRGPQGVNPAGYLAEVALNSQPLPPLPAHELGAAVAAEFIHTIWLAERFGLDPAKPFDDLDDWCPTGPKWPKLPSWWRWWPPKPEPPHPNWSVDFHLGFAARLAASAAEAAGGALSKSLDSAIGRSIDAIESMNR